MTTRSPEEQVDLLRRGTVEIISEEDLLVKLRKGRPLRVKLGLDPSAPDIHIGIAIVLRKLRQFQDLGHEAIIVIGDFTAMIGDPTGRRQTRPMLTQEEVEANAATYRDQYGRVLDAQRTRVTFNSQWLSPLRFADLVRITSKTTVARVLERDDFQTRLRGGIPVFLHEILYPIAQAYDSVELEADVELGGTDQKFNNLMGRDLQREFGQEPQVVVLTPLLPGVDGVEKMSKSLGNAIGITDPPAEMFGKAMSVPDRVMLEYFEFATDLSGEAITEVRRGLEGASLHPRDAKRRLAREIVRMWHGADAAARAEAAFDRVFVARDLPEDIPEVRLDGLRAGTRDMLHRKAVHLLVDLKLAKSHGEARRLITQGGVTVDGQRITDVEADVEIKDGLIVRVGRRRFARVRLS